MTTLNIGKNVSQKDKTNLMRQSKLKQHPTQSSNIMSSSVNNQPQLEKQSSSLSLVSSNNSLSNSQTLTTGRKLKAK